MKCDCISLAQQYQLIMARIPLFDDINFDKKQDLVPLLPGAWTRLPYESESVVVVWKDDVVMRYITYFVIVTLIAFAWECCVWFLIARETPFVRVSSLRQFFETLTIVF